MRAHTLSLLGALLLAASPGLASTDDAPSTPDTASVDESTPLLGAAIPGAPEDHSKILLRADQSRGNLAGIEWTVSVTDDRKTFVYFVQARGHDFLARVTAPKRRKGDTILMVRRNMWFHKKGVSKPVPISQRQKLLGSASYGDIAATNYAEDYQIDAIFRGESNGEACLVFDLSSKPRRKTTYDKLRYWVSTERGVGIRSEFYTVSGRLVKVTHMSYDLEVKVDGETRPFLSQIRFQEKLVGNTTTTMDLSKPRLRRLPASTFNVNLMRR